MRTAPPSSRRLPLLALALLVWTPTLTRAQSPVEETVRRVRQLQREIDELLEALSPAQRAEAERRLAAGDESSTAEVEAAPTAPASNTPEPVAVPAEATPIPDEPVPHEPIPDERADNVLRPVSPARCRVLAVLDTNGDDQITGADRYWRHLYLEVEGDAEPVSLFELDLRGVSVSLDAYTTDKDFVGDVDFGKEAVFRLVGRRRGPSRGVLAVDADGLRRAEGPSLVDSDGRPLEGIQRLLLGLALVEPDGVVHPIACEPANSP